jgi:hypothetical protein
MVVEQEREIDGGLADEIIGKVGDSVWLVFDMDGTLANLKNKDADILRPSLGDFFSKFVEKGVTVYFGIYSNNHSPENLDLVAGKIQALIGGPAKTKSKSKAKTKFHVCFKVHNFHEFRAGFENVKPENILLQPWDRDKTYETIDYAYTQCGHPIDDSKHVFFFDDRHHYSVKDVLHANYIHVSEYKKPERSNTATTKKRGHSQISRHSRKYRKTQRKYRR